MQGYTITKRDPAGKVREVRCETHASCDWLLATPTGRRDDDPIFVAQFERHLKDRATPGLKSLGVLRRGRM